MNHLICWMPTKYQLSRIIWNTSLTLFCLVGVISILMRKLKFRVSKDFTQGHIAIKWQNQHSLSVMGASFPCAPNPCIHVTYFWKSRQERPPFYLLLMKLSVWQKCRWNLGSIDLPSITFYQYNTLFSYVNEYFTACLQNSNFSDHWFQKVQ